MRLAVFSRWPSRDLARGLCSERTAASRSWPRRPTGRILGISFADIRGDSRDAAGLVAGSFAAETFVGVEIGDTGACEPGDYVFLVTFRVPRADQGEFDSWYESEHVARLMEVPGWLRCRRYAVADHERAPTRVALHELASLAPLDSPLRAAAVASEWRQALAERPWFATGTFDTFRRVDYATADGSPPHQ